MKAPPPDPSFYFVPTPIGNLSDITIRAIEVLKGCDLIACEDTRHTLRLLNALDIKKPLISFNAQSEKRKTPELLAQAQGGKKIAVVSDAGMPAVSDPGQGLIQACLSAQVAYTILPGPSAVMTALVGSGFPSHHFTFGGFLPMKKGKKGKLLVAACEQDYTSLFFESPHRLLASLTILASEFPNHVICIARELTKLYETYHRGTSSEVLEYFMEHAPRGEIVLVISPKSYITPVNEL